MAFTAKDWKDYPDTTTPITAAALEDLETRVVAAGLNAITASGKKIAWGVGSTGTWGGNAYVSGSVSSSFGFTPTVVIATCAPIATAAGVESSVGFSVTTLSSSGFDWQARTVNGSNTNNSCAFYWLAIG